MKLRDCINDSLESMKPEINQSTLTTELEVNMATEMYRAELKAYVDRKMKLKAILKSCIGLILRLCTKNMIHCLEDNGDFDTINIQSNAIALLKLIKRIMYNISDNLHPLYAADKALTGLMNCYQKKKDLATYKNNFNSAVAICDQLGVNLEALNVCILHSTIDESILPSHVKLEGINKLLDDHKCNRETKASAALPVREQMLAMMYVL